MMVSFILCLLPALLATASAQDLICEQCYGTVNDCKNPVETCTAPNAKGGCITVVEENTLDGTNIMRILKGCVNDYNSGIKEPVTFTGGNGRYLRINTTRCNTYKCNSAVLEVPKENTNSNGLQCPTCFALNSNLCNSQITACRGNENYCIDSTGILTTRSIPQTAAIFVAKGCATASVQGITAGATLYSSVFLYSFEKVTSKPATSGGSQTLGQFSFALYLPGLAGLLLVKMFP